MSSAPSARIRIRRMRNARPASTSWWRSRRIRNASAIGEAGLDYHYDRAPRDIAARVFRTHIAAARESGLPLVIHARDADQDIAAILKTRWRRAHSRPCCIASPRRANWPRAALALGLSISFSGVLTFKNSDDLRDIARDVPLDRLLVETDAPFLAPVPYRGKRNEPAFVAETAKVLAGVKGVEAELGEITTANALRLFEKMPRRIRPPWRRRDEPGDHHFRLRLVGAACPGSPRAGAPAIQKIRKTAAAAAPLWSSEKAAAHDDSAGRHAGPDLREQLLDAGSIASTRSC